MGKPYPKEFKLKSVEEFLQSGLGPHDWCAKSGLNEDTFYGWVRNFHQYGTPWKPVPERKKQHPPVVKLELPSTQDPSGPPDEASSPGAGASPVERRAASCDDGHPVCEVILSSATIRIYDRIPSGILKEVLSLAGGASC